MEYRNLGRTGVKVSPLCLGTMLFGSKTPREAAFAIVDRAVDAGINFFDTANMYNRGVSEEVLGEALKRNGKRERLIVATKVHFTMGEDDPNASGNSRRHIVQQCEASLKRLGTDWIDLYQIHRPQSVVPIDETLGALTDLVRAGKVRYVGTSTFAAWQLMESVMVSRELALARFSTEQPPLNLLDRRAERELLPFARTYGVGILPWSPLAGGLLTGKYRRGEAIPAGTRFEEAPERPHLQRRLTELFWDRIEGLEELAKERAVPVSQLALRWCMELPGVTSPIVGPRTMDQLEDNLGALDISWDASVAHAVDAICPPGSMASPFYEADFGPHWFR